MHTGSLPPIAIWCAVALCWTGCGNILASDRALYHSLAMENAMHQEIACADCEIRGIHHQYTQRKPGLLLETVDTCDPLLVGELTNFKIRVLNRGDEEDHNIKISVTIPRQLQPIDCSGSTQGVVNGQVVTFEPWTTLQPGESIEYQVTARAKETGDARTRVELYSELSVVPIAGEESTFVY